MPLLKTINDYFIKESKSIKVGLSPFTAHIDLDGSICINESIKKLSGYGGLYWNILHEFIHLDMKRTTGSGNGYGKKDGVNLPNDHVELEIERQVSEMITQNSIAYRLLKRSLKYHSFLIFMSGEDYFNKINIEEYEKDYTEYQKRYKRFSASPEFKESKLMRYLKHIRKKRGYRSYNRFMKILNNPDNSLSDITQDEALRVLFEANKSELREAFLFYKNLHYLIKNNKFLFSNF